MSRCKNCLWEFKESSAWQDFCSLDCAKEYFTRGKSGAALIQARDDFEDWLSNPKNARLVRLDGARAVQPKFGTMTNKTFYREVVHGKGKKAKVERIPVTRPVNVGGAIHIRPMSDSERKAVRQSRGRGSFGENMVDYPHNKLPSENDVISLGWFDHDF